MYQNDFPNIKYYTIADYHLFIGNKVMKISYLLKASPFIQRKYVFQYCHSIRTRHQRENNKLI